MLQILDIKYFVSSISIIFLTFLFEHRSLFIYSILSLALIIEHKLIMEV